MKVSIVQTDIRWCDAAANREHLDAVLQSCGGTDLIVLPEMFSTGFVSEPEGVAETGETLRWMRETARKLDCAIAGSLATGSDGQYRNRFFFVKPDASVEYYDKHHLFTYALEHRHFTAGEQKKIVEWKGFRILLQVCYDLRFPCFSRNALSEGKADYDMILYVASWPEARAMAWKTLLKARAIENQCFVAGVNRVGSDPGNVYTGDSVLLDYLGRELAACTPGREEICSVDCNLEDLVHARDSFPVLNDADRCP